MTRPRKAVVDWFPHSCTHGKTIFVLERKWGIAGYTFWFKLLELLGQTEGHFINFKDPQIREYLQAYTHADNAEEILSLLATIDAIDSELWIDIRIIWSQNFTDGVAEAYRHRKVTVPIKPDNPRKKSLSSGVKHGTPTVEIREGEEKEGERRRGDKDIAPPGPADAVGAVLFFSCPYFDVDLNYRFKLAKEYPALDDDLLRKELSKAEDWVSDNAQKKKFKANGHLASPKLFIKNWLDKVGGIIGPGSDKPKGFAAIERWARKGESHG
jgi:hypothetical protein